jgi:predicted phosphodiesterase
MEESIRSEASFFPHQIGCLRTSGPPVSSQNKFRFQLFSDIHLENYKRFPKIKPLAPFLFLAGDIGNYGKNFIDFFDYCSANWEKVFYVLGNHEYYDKSKTMETLYVDYLALFEKRYKNVFLLNNSFVDIDENLRVYGDIMWTYPPIQNKSEAKIYFNDYNNIRYFDHKMNEITTITPDYIAMYSKAQYHDLVEFLKTNEKKTIIMTHFPPTQTNTSSPKHKNEEQNVKDYFAWPDLIDAVDTTNVVAWISGHTHWSYDFTVNGVRLLSNQMGYREESSKTRFSQDGVFEI